MIADFVEISIIEGAFKWRGVLVEERSLSVEFIVNPFSDVGWAIWTVIERTFSLQSIVFEVSLVVDTIRIGQPSIPIFHIILYHTFESTIIFIRLNNESTAGLRARNQFILAEHILLTGHNQPLVVFSPHFSAPYSIFGRFVDLLDPAFNHIHDLWISVHVFFVDFVVLNGFTLLGLLENVMVLW